MLIRSQSSSCHHSLCGRLLRRRLLRRRSCGRQCFSRTSGNPTYDVDDGIAAALSLRVGNLCRPPGREPSRLPRECRTRRAIAERRVQGLWWVRLRPRTDGGGTGAEAIRRPRTRTRIGRVRRHGCGHSPLKDINPGNVTQLGLAWQYHLGTNRGLEAPRLVIDGIMYAAGNFGRVYALDAASGHKLWTCDPHVDGQWGRYACCDAVNRGLGRVPHTNQLVRGKSPGITRCAYWGAPLLSWPSCRLPSGGT
jgi:PQQ enzyme repeat